MSLIAKMMATNQMLGKWDISSLFQIQRELKTGSLFVFYFFFLLLNAQTDGGLRVCKILDYHSNPIPLSDSSLIIHRFVLSDKKHEVKVSSMQDMENRNAEVSDSTDARLYLSAYFPEKNSRKQRHAPNQRLILIYQSDTMTIDFIDIGLEKSGRGTNQMEHIQFQSGTYKCYLNHETSHKELWDIWKITESRKREILDYLKEGIDERTVYQLKQVGIIEYKPDPNLENKRKKREREACHDKQVGKNYFVLCFSQISAHDKDSFIDITSKQLPIRTDSTSVYCFYYYYAFAYFSNTPDSELILANAVLRKLNSYKIKINGRVYTGCIKLAVHYTDVGISSKYAIDVVHVNYYKKGVLIRTEVLNDVDLDTEQRLNRPG